MKLFIVVLGCFCDVLAVGLLRNPIPKIFVDYVLVFVVFQLLCLNIQQVYCTESRFIATGWIGNGLLLVVVHACRLWLWNEKKTEMPKVVQHVAWIGSRLLTANANVVDCGYYRCVNASIYSYVFLTIVQVVFVWHKLLVQGLACMVFYFNLLYWTFGT